MKLRSLIKNRKTLEIVFLLIITILAAFLRLNKIKDGMPFTFDQAEYSFYVGDILRGKLTLIGPRTGIEGFFLGPLYFYLLVPFYILFNGHPMGGAVMDAIFGILVIPAIYFLAKEMFGRKVAALTSFLACFSPLLIGYSRYSWNPHPLVLFSVIFYYSLFKVIKGQEKCIMLAFFALAVGLQMEIASAVFLLPTAIIVFIWNKYRPKILFFWLVGLTILFLSWLPQILFNIRHEFIMVKAILAYISNNERFTNDLSFVINTRIVQYFSVFRRVMFTRDEILFPLLMLLTGLIYLSRQRQSNTLSYRLLISWLTVNFLMLFFSGERIWEHHYISIYPAFIILGGLTIANLWKQKKDKIFSLVIILIFLGFNVYGTWPKKTNENELLLFKHQLQAINYIYKESKGKPFNVYIYVPSVYDHSYRYIFEWYGKEKYGYLPDYIKKEKLVYFIIESDNELPVRRTNWLDTKKEEGIPIKIESFGGGLIVEKRVRK